MIPDEAVEAAAKALWARARIDPWEDARDWLADEFRDEARAALEAAAPHILAPVLALADDWETRGECDMALSKTIDDEHVSTSLLTEGASMVENARHIRNAIAGTK